MKKVDAPKSLENISKRILTSSVKVKEKLLNELKKDQREGAKNLVVKIERHLEKEKEKERNTNLIYSLERNLYKKGFKKIAGVDEAGRGSLAGPIVAAAIILPKTPVIHGLKDSKQLTPKQREETYVKILAEDTTYKVVVFSSIYIDRHGLHKVNLEALEKAALNLKKSPDFVLVDGYRPAAIKIPSLRIMKGDVVSASIAAASIIAKVYRDRLMRAYGKKYQQYGFDSNKGYGSKKHYEAIRKYGLCPIHRKSFNII